MNVLTTEQKNLSSNPTKNDRVVTMISAISDGLCKLGYTGSGKMI